MSRYTMGKASIFKIETVSYFQHTDLDFGV